MEERHMGWVLLRGVRRDILNLIKNFEGTESIRFSDFSKVWRDLNFSHIFRGRANVSELLEFTEETMHITKTYLLPAYKFQTRIGALYTLYGLYFKQPLKQMAKIRFTMSEWKEFDLLIKQCKNEHHYDAAFIFFKLYYSHAFVFTVVPRATGLERGFRKYDDKWWKYASSSKDVDQIQKPFVESDLLGSFAKMESLYCNKKSELLDEKDLLFVDNEFAKKLKNKVEKYAQGSANTSSNAGSSDEACDNYECEDEDSDHGESSEDSNATSIGARRSQLRTKAFSQGKKAWAEESEVNATVTKLTAEKSKVDEDMPLKRNIAHRDTTRKRAKLVLERLQRRHSPKKTQSTKESSDLAKL